MEEEQLIAAVSRVKLASEATLTAAEVHKVLASEGLDVSLSQVKKAASKAAKNKLDVPVAAPAATAAPPAPNSAKQAEKKAKAAREALKATEAAMMEQQKALRNRWLAEGHGSVPPYEGAAFVQYVTSRALAGALSDGEELTRERVEADVATLEWMLLAHAEGQLPLPDDASEGAASQLERLRSVRGGGNRQLEAAKAFYVVSPASLRAGADAESEQPVQPLGSKAAHDRDTGSLDRAMAKAGMLNAGIGGQGAMDEMD